MENELHREPATPEEIWAILHEVSKKHKESALEMEEIRKSFEKSREEAERRQREIDQQIKETGEQMKQTDRRFDRRMNKLEELFTGQWGKLMESLVEGDLVALLQARGVTVQSTHPRVRGRRNGEHYEFDILAGNGEEIVVVEVKTTLKVDDVKQFLVKLNKFTEYEPVYRGKQVYGAVAYLRTEQDSELYSERQGLFVIRATGSSASIINQTDFVPRVFR